MGGAPPPQGSAQGGEEGEAAPQGSGGPQGPEAEGAATVGGGEGPAEPTGAAAAPGAPQGSTALSSISALCQRHTVLVRLRPRPALGHTETWRNKLTT